MSEDQKVGGVLARFQPLHNAHMWLIEKALKENDKVFIALGSSNKSQMLRNPFPFNLRLNMLRGALENSEDINRIKVFDLPDWSQENNVQEATIWGHYFYYNVVSRIEQKHFSLYYSDDINIVKSWFDDEISNYIKIEHQDRLSIYDNLSATKIRNALLNFSAEDKEYLKNCLPENVYKMTDHLRKLWIDVIANPKSDFSMI